MSHDVRGIVVSTPVVAKRGILRIDTPPLDSQELRYWLLFWDKLNFPLLSGIHIHPGRDGDFLQEVGILRRHPVTDVRIRISGNPDFDDPEEQFQHHFLRAFRELDAAERGTWSLATGERSITLDDDELTDGRGVLVRLHHALPVPDRDVPLEDILTFKEKRRDELLGLRCHLEAVYARVMAAPDSPLALNSELTALDRSLSDYLKSTKSGAVKLWRFTSIDAELQLLPGINAAVTAFSSGLPLLQALTTGASAMIGVSAALGLKGLRRESDVPWRYVARYLDEVFTAGR